MNKIQQKHNLYEKKKSWAKLCYCLCKYEIYLSLSAKQLKKFPRIELTNAYSDNILISKYNPLFLDRRHKPS